MKRFFNAYCTVRKTLKGPMAREKYGACGVDFSLNSVKSKHDHNIMSLNILIHGMHK